MMSIVVNTHGQVCVASDNVYEGIPSSVSFDPDRRLLTLQFEDGRQERLGTAGLSEICRLLHKARSIRFMQIRKPDPSYQIQLPLYVRMENDSSRYAVAG
jgi:hypothetical protein